MMTKPNTTVNVFILDKEYKVSCPVDERDALLKSAEYLNQKMKDVRSAGKVLGLESIAVIAALNITHELLKEIEKSKAYGTKEDVESLLTKVEEALES